MMILMMIAMMIAMMITRRNEDDDDHHPHAQYCHFSTVIGCLCLLANLQDYSDEDDDDDDDDDDDHHDGKNDNDALGMEQALSSFLPDQKVNIGCFYELLFGIIVTFMNIFFWSGFCSGFLLLLVREAPI